MSDTPNEYEEIIKFSELKKAIDDCFEHIRNLLKTAKHLHHNNDYSKSIFFTIIAFEEFGKLFTYTEYYKNQKGVPRKEIRKLSKHPYKLKKLFYNHEIMLSTISEEQLQNEEK